MIYRRKKNSSLQEKPCRELVKDYNLNMGFVEKWDIKERFVYLKWKDNKEIVFIFYHHMMIQPEQKWYIEEKRNGSLEDVSFSKLMEKYVNGNMGFLDEMDPLKVLN